MARSKIKFNIGALRASLWYMQLVSIFILLTALATAALGQEFEAVSVKPSKAATDSSSTQSNQGRFTATNVTLKNLIVRAYDLKDYQLEGPDWLSSLRFDVVAKYPEALPKDREKYNAALQAMMREMLSERFKLAAHRDQKTFSVYALVVSKPGIKFKQVPDSDSHNSSSNNTHFVGTCISVAMFADFLARRMDLPVIDMTDLKGFYNLTLDWVPESKADAPVDLPSGLTLRDAIQEQLGLKLESRQAPLEILIVDHAEKVPTEN